MLCCVRLRLPGSPVASIHLHFQTCFPPHQAAVLTCFCLVVYCGAAGRPVPACSRVAGREHPAACLYLHSPEAVGGHGNCAAGRPTVPLLLNL